MLSERCLCILLPVQERIVERVSTNLKQGFRSIMHKVVFPILEISRICVLVLSALSLFYLCKEMVTQPEAWVCGRSLAGIAGLNPAGGMDVCLLCVLCYVRYRSLRRADPSSKEVLPNVCVCH
jgi:hypothetical protein